MSKFHSSYLRRLVLAARSLAQPLWKTDHVGDAEKLWEVSVSRRGSWKVELISAGSRSYRAEAADVPHLGKSKEQRRTQTHTCRCAHPSAKGPPPKTVSLLPIFEWLIEIIVVYLSRMGGWGGGCDQKDTGAGIKRGCWLGVRGRSNTRVGGTYTRAAWF